MNIPVIETKRLLLRAHNLADFNACAAMWADPEVVRHIGGKPSSTQQTWARMLQYAGHWSLMGFGYWAVEEKMTGRYIGELGFADFKREITPSIQGIPEAGWAFASEAHGKGYGAEALQVILSWFDESFDDARSVCMISPENLNSIRLAKKCGYQEFCHTSYFDKPTILFERKTM